VKSLSVLARAAGSAALFVVIASCTENLDSSGACSVLCPPIGGDIQNITLDAAVLLDTTVQSLSGLGSEPGLILASRGDTLDTRVVIRFDSLPQKFTVVGDTAGHPITSVDSAFIQLLVDTTSIKGTGPVTIEAYDVDTTANDTSTAAVLALFRPDRFISSQTFARTDLKDTLNYFISNAAVLAKIQSATPLRIGLRATSPASFQIRFFSTEASFPPKLSFRPTPDTTVAPLTGFPFSRTPTNDPIAATHISDYTIIAKGPPPAPLSDLAVGGLPARRVYLKFDIPAKIIDSSTVVRATLLLNQLPNPLLDPNDTVKILPGLVLAGNAVTDPTRAAQIETDIQLDTVFVKAGGSGLTEVEIARAFSIWRTQSADTTARALVLRSVNEGISPLEAAFSSSEAAPALRPRLRISFVTRVPLGLP
jgi:hypothetical protein